MECLERLRRVTERIGVYNLDREPSVAAELYAYSVGISWVERELMQELEALFPATAGGDGLRRFERLLHLDPSGALEQRRQAVYEKLVRRPGAWSREEYFDALMDSGFTGTWSEEPENFTLRLQFDSGFTVEQMRDAFAASYRLLPAHLRPATAGDPLTWDQIDAAMLPFSQWEESCICWDAMDAV